MSYSIDVNILLYASDQGNPHYPAAKGFLEERPSDPALFCITWMTLMSYLRISTHSGIFSNPLSPDAALGNIASLLSLPRLRVITEEEGFLDIYRLITGRFPVRGNLVSDAHLASVLFQHGVHKIYTNDRDFVKFDFLKVINPFHA